jgi:hypothetical protein
MRIYNPATNEYGTVVGIVMPDKLCIRYDNDTAIHIVHRNQVEMCNEDAV